MTDPQINLIAELRSVFQRLMDIEPSHSHTPGLHRRVDGIIKDLYRTGMTRDQIDQYI